MIDSFQVDFGHFYRGQRVRFSLNKGICPDLVVGDFDSVSRKSWLWFVLTPRRYFVNLKNDTDLELAVKTAFVRYPQASDYLRFGGRLDHLPQNTPNKLLLVRKMISVVLAGYHEIKASSW